jgi:hypothetical protein
MLLIIFIILWCPNLVGLVLKIWPVFGQSFKHSTTNIEPLISKQRSNWLGAFG